MDERYRKYKTIEIAFKARARGDRELICMFWGRWRELMRVWNYMITIRHDVRRRTALLDQVRENYLKDVLSVKLALSQARKNGTQAAYASTIEPTPSLDLRGWAAPPSGHKAKFDELETLGYLKLAGIGEEAEKKRDGYEIIEESTIPCYAPHECAFLSRHCDRCQGILAIVYARNERVTAALGLVTNWEKFQADTKDELLRIPDLEKQTKILREQLVNTGSLLSASELKVNELEDALQALQKKYTEDTTNLQKRFDVIDKIAGKVPDLEKEIVVLTEFVHKLERVHGEKLKEISNNQKAIADLEELVVSSKVELERQLAVREAALSRAKQGLLEANGRAEMTAEELRFQQDEAVPILKSRLEVLEKEAARSQIYSNDLQAELRSTKNKLETAELRGDRLAVELSGCRADLAEALTPPVVSDAEVQASPSTAEVGLSFQWSEHLEPTGIFQILPVSQAVEAFSDAPEEVTIRQTDVNMGHEIACQFTPATQDGSTHCVLKTEAEIRLENELEDSLDQIESLEDQLERTNRSLRTTQVELKLANEEAEEAANERDEALELVETIETSTRDKLNSQWRAKYMMQVIVSKISLNTQQALTQRLAGMLNGMKLKIKGQTSFLSKLSSGTTKLANGSHDNHKAASDGGAMTSTSESDLEAKAQELEKQRMKLIQERIQDKSEMKKQLARDKAEMEQNISKVRAEAKSEINDSRAEVAAISRLAGEQLQELERTKLQVEKHQIELEAVTNKAKKQEEELIKASKEFDDYQLNVNKLAQEAQIKADELAKAQSEFDKQNEYYESISLDGGPQSEEIELAKKELDKYRNEVEKLALENEKKSNLLQNAQTELDLKRNLVNNLSNETNILQKEKESLSEQLTKESQDAEKRVLEAQAEKQKQERAQQQEEGTNSSTGSKLVAKMKGGLGDMFKHAPSSNASAASHADDLNSLETEDDDNLELMGGNGDASTFHHDAEALENFSQVIDNRVEELLERAREADKKVAQLRFVLAVRTAEARQRADDVHVAMHTLDTVSAKMAAERQLKEKLQSQISTCDDRIVQLQKNVKSLTVERDEARQVGEDRQALIEEGLKREENLHEEVKNLKNAYDALAAQRLEELEQLNNALEVASQKISDLQHERDLLLGDKELLTSAVNDAYRTHCNEVKRVFLDNLKQTRSVGTQLDCCVCAMRTQDQVMNSQIPLNNSSQSYISSSSVGGSGSISKKQNKKDRNKAKGTFRSSYSVGSNGSGHGNINSSKQTSTSSSSSTSTSVHPSVLPTSNSNSKFNSNSKINIVVDRTGQRYPFSVGESSTRNVSINIGPTGRQMDAESLGLHLPRSTPIGNALLTGKLVPSSHDLRPQANNMNSIHSTPSLLPTDQARKERQSHGQQQQYQSSPSSSLMNQSMGDLTNDDDISWQGSGGGHGGNKQRLLDDALSSHLENERFRASHSATQSLNNNNTTDELSSSFRQKKNLSPLRNHSSGGGVRPSFQRQESDMSDADFNFYPSLSQFAPPAPPKQKVDAISQVDGYSVASSTHSIGSESHGSISISKR